MGVSHADALDDVDHAIEERWVGGDRKLPMGLDGLAVVLSVNPVPGRDSESKRRDVHDGPQWALPVLSRQWSL